MTSYEYNLYLQDTEYYLDILYEKIRVIEDLLDYLDNYNIQKTDKLIAYIKEKENKLQDSIDKFVSNKSQAYEVTWDTGDLDIIQDRDGSEIKRAEIYSGIENYLGFGNVKKSKLKLTSIVKESSETSYSDNIVTCLNDGFYLSSYNLDKPTNIEEKIYIEVNDKENARFLNLRPINCSIEDKGTDELGRKTYILKSNAMSKVDENFIYKNYIGSQLEATRVDSNFSYNVAKDINQNQNEQISLDNQKNNKDYYDKVLNYQTIASTQEKEGSVLSIYNGE